MNGWSTQEKGWNLFTAAFGLLLGGFFLAAGVGVIDLYLVFLPLAIVGGLGLGRWRVLFALGGVLLACAILAMSGGYEPTDPEPPSLIQLSLYTLVWQGFQLGLGVAVRKLIDRWRVDHAEGRRWIQIGPPE